MTHPRNNPNRPFSSNRASISRRVLELARDHNCCAIHLAVSSDISCFSRLESIRFKPARPSIMISLPVSEARAGFSPPVLPAGAGTFLKTSRGRRPQRVDSLQRWTCPSWVKRRFCEYVVRRNATITGSRTAAERKAWGPRNFISLQSGVEGHAIYPKCRCVAKCQCGSEAIMRVSGVAPRMSGSRYQSLSLQFSLSGGSRARRGGRVSDDGTRRVGIAPAQSLSRSEKARLQSDLFGSPSAAQGADYCFVDRFQSVLSVWGHSLTGKNDGPSSTP